MYSNISLAHGSIEVLHYIRTPNRGEGPFMHGFAPSIREVHALFASEPTGSCPLGHNVMRHVSLGNSPMAVVRDADWRKYCSRLGSASRERKWSRSGLAKQKGERAYAESHRNTIVVEPIATKNHRKVHTLARVGNVAIQTASMIADPRRDTP